MAGGLVALLDDVAAIAKLAAASLDDVGAAAGRAGAKAAGVVVDDAAVTPRYVTGFTPERELPIIGRIALGSLRNKLLLLLPVALLLSAVAPWAVTPLLMLGGLFLCFEGAEKVAEATGLVAHHEEGEAAGGDPAAMEAAKVSGAIRTDLILSAEIMAIALGEVADAPIVTRAVALAAVAVLITAGVYGAVGLIVKMDDIGLHLARRGGGAVRALGRGLVRAMPLVMWTLATIGIAAMLWVGGGILLHGLEGLGIAAPAHLAHEVATQAGAAMPALGGAIAWAVQALLSGVVGLIVGAALTLVVARFRRKQLPGGGASAETRER